MTEFVGLNIELKKGDAKQLKGKLIAYATVDPDSDPSSSMNSMTRNGILAVQANYIDQRNIKDFFQAEFGVSLEKGIQEIIEQARESGGLEGALDPSAVRDKLESMRNMEFIPIPAKITFFDSEEGMLDGEEDVYYLGHFKIISHAHLCVNSFPILYQAKFREQEHLQISSEIEDMLKSLGPDTAPAPSESEKKPFSGNIKDRLLKKLIPNMIYKLDNKSEFEAAENQFRQFMTKYGHDEHIEELVELVRSGIYDNEKKRTLLELLIDEIQALQNEDFQQLEQIKLKIKKLK